MEPQSVEQAISTRTMADTTPPSNYVGDTSDNISGAEGDYQNPSPTPADAAIPQPLDKVVQANEMVDFRKTITDDPTILMSHDDLVEFVSERLPEHMKIKLDHAIATLSRCQQEIMERKAETLGAMDSEPKFGPFPRLPTELRLKIWRHAIPRGRVVQLLTSWNPGAYTDWDTTHTLDVLNCRVITSRVTLLSTCRESREVAQAFYKPFIAKSCNDKTTFPFLGPKVVFKGKIGIRCDFERDQFLFGARGFQWLDRIGEHLDLSRVRDVVVSMKNVGIGSQLFFNICQYFYEQCPNLTYLKFAVGGGPRWTAQESSHSLVFIPVDSNLEDIIDFRTQRVMNEHEARQRGLYAEHRMEIRRGRAIKRQLDTFVQRKAPEWKRLIVEVAFLSRKASDSNEWTIRCERGPTVSNLDFVRVSGKDEKRADRYVGIWELFEGHSGG